MLDDFRKQAEISSPEEAAPAQPQRGPASDSRVSGLMAALKSDRRVLGLTPVQRFVVSAMILVVTALGSAVGLILLGKVVP